MRKKALSKKDEAARAPTPVPAAPACEKVRAVAFRIEGKVYEGRSGASHATLYISLLREKRVAAHAIEIWTSSEKNHGFVTENGEFLDRSEVMSRFGADRSEDLQAKGLVRSTD